MTARPLWPAVVITALACAAGWAVVGYGNGWRALEPRSCRAASVTDGDSLRVACGPWQTAPVRLADLDAPARDACPAQATAATAALQALVDGQPLHVTPRYRDRWGRIVATVETPAGDVGAQLLATRHARPWPHDNTGHALAPRPEGC